MHRIPLGAWLVIGILAHGPVYAQTPDVRAPEIGEEDIRAMVSRSLEVEILKVEVVDHAGQPAYAITVMNPPGNRNDALRVATLLFDGATGSLLGQESPAPHTAAPGLETATTPHVEDGGREIRRRSNR